MIRWLQRITRGTRLMVSSNGFSGGNLTGLGGIRVALLAQETLAISIRFMHVLAFVVSFGLMLIKFNGVLGVTKHWV
jgi:hypothetical protein